MLRELEQRVHVLVGAVGRVLLQALTDGVADDEAIGKKIISERLFLSCFQTRVKNIYISERLKKISSRVKIDRKKCTPF